MIITDFVLLAFGLAGVVASLLNRKLVWWNTTRAEFVLRSFALAVMGALLVALGYYYY